LKALGIGVLTILAVIAAGFVAQRIFGTHRTMSTAEAGEAIEGLPHPVQLTETPAHVLVGEVDGNGGVVVHFAVADSLGASGIPPRLRRIDPEPTGGGSFWVWDDSARQPGAATKARRDEEARIATEIDEAICRKETGDPCPA
jgi:hypothetical protein